MGGSNSGDNNFTNPYADYSQMAGGQTLSNGLPTNIANILGTGSQALGQQAQQFLPQIQQYLQQAQAGNQDATNQGLSQLGSINQQGEQQLQGMESQNQGQVQSLLDNYNKSYAQSLGPNGALGQQLMGEYNNYGLTPSSGGFQAALGTQMANLGGQNALTLGQDALMPGIQAGYSMLGQNQQQQGQLSNQGSGINQQLGSQMGTAPLNLMQNVLGQQMSLTNEGTQLPIQNWQNSMGYQAGQNLGNQNVAAQNYGAQMGLLGNLGGGAMSGIGAAYGK